MTWVTNQRRLTSSSKHCRSPARSATTAKPLPSITSAGSTRRLAINQRRLTSTTKHCRSIAKLTTKAAKPRPRQPRPGVYSALNDKLVTLDFYNQALPLYRQVDDKGGEATTLNNLGTVYDDLGDKPAALAFYIQALPLRRQVGDKPGEAATLNNLGLVYDDLGDKPAALDFYTQALSLYRQVGDKAAKPPPSTTLVESTMTWVTNQQHSPSIIKHCRSHAKSVTKAAKPSPSTTWPLLPIRLGIL